ncbi:MAG: serine hydrolase domain-containing protein, partial [Emcibacteraceae bacterium]
MLQIFLKIIFILVTMFGMFSIPASSRDLKELELDTFVNAAMKSFKIPGVAIGVIKNNNIQHLKGYGVKNINRSELIDADTMYSIASNTKAFTASALAILVDDEIINWDDKVIDYLPNFRMMDPW